jgi:inner membrane protein
MDNLTHTLTGLMMSRAGLRRFHPQAPLIMMLSANMPDMDVISGLMGGAPVYFHYHRWMTHALVSIPFVALIPVLVALLLQRFRGKQGGGLLAAWLLSLVGVASHVLLDYTNPYGIRLFLPWNESWPMLSITSVVDVWIWTILLVATLAPMLGRLVSSEIGARPGTGRGLAITALLLVGAYDTGRYFLHERAIAMLDGQMYNGETPVRVHAYPTTMNPLLWDGVVETGAFFVQRRISVAGNAGDWQGKVYYKPEASPAIAAAARDPLVRRLVGFSKSLWWQSTPASDVEGGTRVSATDLFFGFTATAIVDRNNHVVDSTFHF